MGKRAPSASRRTCVSIPMYKAWCGCLSITTALEGRARRILEACQPSQNVWRPGQQETLSQGMEVENNRGRHLMSPSGPCMCTYLHTHVHAPHVHTSSPHIQRKKWKMKRTSSKIYECPVLMPFQMLLWIVSHCILGDLSMVCRHAWLTANLSCVFWCNILNVKGPATDSSV